MKLKGTEADNIIRAISADHARYIKCKKTKDGYSCSVRGQTNDVRKTINEFLESILYLEKVSESLDARVG